MTTPNAGLEGLVGLSERATGGPWKSSAHDAGEIGFYGCGYRIALMTGGEVNRNTANSDFIAALVNWFRGNYQSLPQPGAEGDARDAARYRWLEKNAYVEFNDDDGNGWVCDAGEPVFTTLSERVDTALASRRELGGVSGEVK